jgi:mono/diheme cytochrome c family protein
MSESRLPKAFATAALVALVSLTLAAVWAQKATDGTAPASAEPILSSGFRFAEQSGEALYDNVCQACHMPDGKGASGAGTYPSLAGDQNLAARGFPIYVVINGQRGMPPIGLMMSDDQVAAVVNYVRTHFGNAYQDAASAEDVKVVRP